MDLLAPPTAHERHLSRVRFRLSCQCRLVSEAGAIDVPHDAPRPHAHRASCAATCRSVAHRMPLDPAVVRDGSRIVDRVSGRDRRRVERSDSRSGDGSRHDDGRRATDQPRDRRARGRCLVREPAALRRLRRDVADSLRHRAQGQAAPANAGGLPDARDRGVSRRSQDDLRSRRRRQFDDARHLLPPERVFDRADPVPVDHRDRDGRGTADDDQPDRDGTPLPAADPSRGACLRCCRSSAGTSAPTPPPACSPSAWRTKTGWSRSWTSAPTPSSSSATSTGSWPRRAPPVPRSRAARSPAACPDWTAPSRMYASTTTGAFTLGVIGGGVSGGICGSGLVDLMSELLRTGRMNDMGRFEDGVSRFTLDEAHDVYFLESDVNELAQAEGRQRRRPARRLQPLRRPVRGRRRVLPRRRLRTAPEERGVAGGSGSSRTCRMTKIVQVGNAAIEGACIALLSIERREALEALVRASRALPAGDASGLLRLLRRRVSVQADAVGESGAWMIELVDTCPDVNVQPAEYKRLLGYPRDWVRPRSRPRARRLGSRLVRAARTARGCTPAKRTRWRPPTAE